MENATQDAGSEAAATLARQAQRLGVWARIVLVPVAVIGAVLSYQSLYTAAEPTFGSFLAAGFPLLVDLLILGASLQYVAGAKIGRPMNGWRLTAHCGVAGTLVLNALAAAELGEVPWHITAPAVWAVLVELTGKQVLGQWKAAHGQGTGIASALWLSAPIESARTRLLMARTGVADATQARIGVGTAAAAREALSLSLPRKANARKDARRVRRVVNRQLRAGSLAPAAVLVAVGWNEADQNGDLTPDTILRAVVQNILHPAPTLLVGGEPGTSVQEPDGPDEAESRTEHAVILNELRERHPDWPTETVTDVAGALAPGGVLPTPAPRAITAVADAAPESGPEALADTEPQDTPATPAPTVKPSVSRRPGRTTSTRDKVLGLREKHPDWTVAKIAKQVGVSDRTTRRYLNGDGASESPAQSPAA
ncbi:hypothetical protein GCM10022223_46920 [Kineosporia mesophila]|uniref:Homeodomain-like domain-containing protein n=1 Tax=Kineosporia mesophila TaxID=566012 RepID=A0ABP7A433_9ACTN|nr:DUF2637 domain-containing protein [Kineosporia mesophila]MCD5353801.1 DUF2637 domain-containing protein [Kineosporia mesophila]